MKNTSKLTVVLSIIGLLALASCSEVQDRPLPASTKNAEDLLLILQDRFYSYEPSPGQNEDMVRLAVYKSSIEEDLGYNFDKTFRFVHFFFRESGDMGRVIAPIVPTIRNDPQSALDSGYISVRTFDMLVAERKARYAVISSKQEDFLSYILECQQLNDGICTSSQFLNILLEKESSRGVFENVETIEDELSILQINLASTFDAREMGSKGWVTTPAGEQINTCCLLEMDHSGIGKEFIVDSEQVALSKKYTQLIEEEKFGLLN